MSIVLRDPTFAEIMSEPVPGEPEYEGKPPAEAAAEQGLDIIFPAANELFIDIDDADSLATFESQTRILLEVWPDAKWTIGPSRNRAEGRHIVVTMPRDLRSELERLALQAMLGSDRKRELLGMKRLAYGMSNVSCFFVAKAGAK